MVAGDNSLTGDLRLLSSLELFLNNEDYVCHPYFESVLNLHKESYGDFVNEDLIFDKCL